MSNAQISLGARVRILTGKLAGEQGTIYRHMPERPAPWHVRPDLWPADEAGIAYTAKELQIVECVESTLNETDAYVAALSPEEQAAFWHQEEIIRTGDVWYDVSGIDC